MKKEIKPKKCRICSEKFIPNSSIQVVCSLDCSIQYSENKSEKKWKERKSEMKEGLRTFSYYANILQKKVNEAVRIRDNGRECISCKTILNSSVKKFDAGHFFNVGSYPELRFKWKNNIHGQCVECNQHKGGNYHEYRIKLIERIGEERFQQLEAEKNIPSGLSRSDLKALILEFKEIIKKTRE